MSDINAILDRHGIKRCGDSSCIFGPRGGMMTNGGCRCGHDDPGAPSRPTRLSRQLAHAVTEQAAEIARLTAELAAARAEVDCGQDGPCAKAPGCARHWQERNRELVAELAAARAVTAGVCRYLDCAASDLLAVVTSLYETRARAISDATAARGTVGGQTGPVGKLLGSHAIVEWYAAPDWYQARIAQHRTGTVKGADLRWRHENARNWSSWGQPWGDPAQHMDQPARLVPAAEADADPNQRGPLPKGG